MCQPPRRPDLLGVYHNEKCTQSLLYAGYQAGVEGVENKSDSAPLVSQGRWMFTQASQATCRQEGWEQGALVLGSALLLGVHTTLLPGTEPKAIQLRLENVVTVWEGGSSHEDGLCARMSSLSGSRMSNTLKHSQ